MNIRLMTDAPWLFSDICEVVRLFAPEAAISMEAGETALTHAHAEVGADWRETWTMDGRAVVERLPAPGTWDAQKGGNAAWGSAESEEQLNARRLYKRALKTGLFRLFTEATGQRPPWGSLTGIRPTRLLYEALEAGMTLAEGERWLCETFFVSPERARLLREILEMQRPLMGRAANDFDLYIGIPFCTTRCAYCSFSSGTLGDGHLVEPYVAALLREIEQCAAITERMGLRVRAAYVGGGTPTAISADQLARVLDAAQAAFRTKESAREWTVEAGRPDTIDREKLAMLLSRGIGRISINPQTFSDRTLQAIGRAHTSADTSTAYRLAREMGFADINMDLIAALPGEELDDFRRTLEAACRLAPESVTVHTLAIKRSSKLNEAGYAQTAGATVERMVTEARARLTEAGYRPYYLYRQKYMAGNLENVGYAKPGQACLYNVDIMEETIPNLALGAGAITKWLFPRTRRIERAANVKNIEEYISRVDEMVVRKKKLLLEG